MYCITYRKNKLLFYNSFNLFLLHGLKATVLLISLISLISPPVNFFYFSGSLVFFKAKATHQTLYLTEIKSPSGITHASTHYMHCPISSMSDKSICSSVKKHPQYTIRRAVTLDLQFGQPPHNCMPPCVAGGFARPIYVPNTPQPGQLDLIRYST